MTVVLTRPGVVLLNCDARSLPLPDESVQCCVTSPPYWGLRDYGTPGQLGLEKTPEEYVANMVAVFREVRRVLKKNGVLWLNLGDSFAGSGKGAWNNKNGGQKEVYIPDSDSPQALIPKVPFGLKPKDLVGIPWRVAFALQADGWYLRSDIIWSKPNPMPESVTDRPTKAHEYIFLMSKNKKYYYDTNAIAEPLKNSSIERLAQPNIGAQKGSDRVPGKTNGPMKAVGGKLKKQDGTGNPTYTGFNARYKESPVLVRNKRTVWNIATQPYKGSHFATFPEEIPRICISAGSKVGDVVLDPFGGSGTTGKVALELGRKIVHVDIGYHDLAIKRMGLNATRA